MCSITRAKDAKGDPNVPKWVILRVRGYSKSSAMSPFDRLHHAFLLVAHYNHVAILYRFRDIAIHVFYFKSGQNRRRISGRKSALYTCIGYKKNKTPGRFPPNFLCECLPRPLTYIPSFIQIRSGLGEI